MSPTPIDPSGTTLVVGVLGGIASGKSHVARVLAGAEGLVLDADRLARQELERADLRERLRAAFGPSVLTPEGRVDTEALAGVVFGDPAARARLEGWIHPAVRATIEAEVREARTRGLPCVVLDVPLLLENEAKSGLAEACDVLVFVDSAPAERERRARASRGWPAGEVRRREATQIPLEQKRARAHHVIDNRGSVAELEAAAKRLALQLGLRS